MKVREKRSVYFDGSFWGHSGRDHAGREISINKRFRWADRDWLIPAMYICGKGLVVEFCMQIDPKQIMAFMDKWSLNMETDSYRNFSREQQMEIDGENPLHFDFQPKVLLNGKELVTSHGCGVSYNPCLPEDIINELEAKQAMDYYGLDDSRGWMILRSAFPWKTKRRPEIRTISVTMEQRMAAVPGMHFCVSAVGDSIEFCHPGLLVETDKWARRRIRAVYWKQWKRVRIRYRILRKLKLEHWQAMKLANSRSGYWRMAEMLNTVLTNKIIARLV